MTKTKRQHYEEYLPRDGSPADRQFMAREGDPCRHCLCKFQDHYNGMCPKDEGESS